ncbi:hypothetical protein DL764_004918 [Monosporascus ibericus]|uniref:Alpha-L-rhamnosidase six-hairpin glycosidase domain-containing protein n=1 Tax=Monosporascus ibericus TaxID=155417 RepID=A0A4Q4TEQ9_9PEZI|nr:hypothetical protein DL764_004918 [Monosporascus ibericus]
MLVTRLSQWLALSTFALLTAANDDSKPWEAYINSPSSRHIRPRSIKAISGDAVIHTSPDGVYTLHMKQGSQITLDFSYVGGLLSMTTSTSESVAENDPVPHFSLAFAESPAFIRAISDDTKAVPTQDYDKALNVTVAAGSQAYAMPRERFRGGFQYVTIHAFRSVSISDVVCELGYTPSQQNPRDWEGHFWTDDDELLVRMWYAGVFTAQTNIAPPHTSRWLPQVVDGWAYNATLGVEGPMLLDGAKRDRAVWSGDLGIAGTTAFLGLGSVGLESVYYALETMFYFQNETDGMLPYSGPTTGSWRKGSKSDVYHAWVLVACFNYAIYTGNETWIDIHWDNITRGVEYVMQRLDNDVGLAEQVYDNDWARLGGGGYNSALNALNYHALASLASLAADTATERNGREQQANDWSAAAARLKTAFNTVLWDESAKLYRDNETTAGARLFPQDGNSLALLYSLTTSREQSTAVSEALTRNWNNIGPVTPELPDTISTFISSVEVLAHYAADQPGTALKLMRRTWGYMLESPLMTGTTLVEGMSANGSLAYRSMRSYNYDSTYTSLSHSWSTGPTQALSFKGVGLEIVGWKKWIFRPQPGDLKSLETAYMSPMGEFEASVQFSDKGILGWLLDATLKTPKGTSGTMDLPFRCKTVTVNGWPVSWQKPVTGGGVKRILGVGCDAPQT